MNRLKLISRGIFRENPVFVLMLGMCPTLGTTSSAVNGMGMGVATMAVLILSNAAISLVKGLIPSKVRIPAYVVIVASLVTMVQLLMQAYMPGLFDNLGVFIPLITVNCIILARAEGFASKHGLYDSVLDAVGMGLGFAVALTLLGAVREALGSGSVFGYQFIGGGGILFFVLAPGAFIVLGYLMVLFNRLTAKMK